MSLINHAWNEFIAAGWCNEAKDFNDEMQEDICMHVLKLLKVFSEEGHSGTSAPYAINLFSTLAYFKPLTPLTGEDWEWNDVSEFNGLEDSPLYQNKRCSSVFKDNTGAYDIEGIIFYDWCTDEKTGEKFKTYFTSRESRVPVTFPHSPKSEYVERSDG
jgi:hypothetical protein